MIKADFIFTIGGPLVEKANHGEDNPHLTRVNCYQSRELNDSLVSCATHPIGDATKVRRQLLFDWPFFAWLPYWFRSL